MATYNAAYLLYGKFVQSDAEHTISGYQTLQHTPYDNFDEISGLMPRKIYLADFCVAHIENQDVEDLYKEVGVLIFIVPEDRSGFKAMRVRFRPEDGKNGNARNFSITSSIHIPEIRTWDDVPSALITWCFHNLKADPITRDDKRVVPPIEIDITGIEPNPELDGLIQKADGKQFFSIGLKDIETCAQIFLDTFFKAEDSTTELADTFTGKSNSEQTDNTKSIPPKPDIGTDTRTDSIGRKIGTEGFSVPVKF